jgi:pyridoxine/pyridoxamine 5'-phosphate oxidase
MSRDRTAGYGVRCLPSGAATGSCPDEIELWEHREDRLHDRLRHRRNAAGGWQIELPAP